MADKEKRLLSFNILPLGTRFRYKEWDEAVYAKIDYNMVARWDATKIGCMWLGQIVMSAFDDDRELKTKVEVVE